MDKYVTENKRDKIKGQTDFNKEIKHNPIALLEAIRTLTHDPIRAQYPFLSLFDSLYRLITIRPQEEHESLQEYIIRFKQVRDNFKKHCGTKFLDHFVELLAEYQENAPADQIGRAHV